jgi:hypothetical protein
MLVVVSIFGSHSGGSYPMHYGVPVVLPARVAERLGVS